MPGPLQPRLPWDDLWAYASDDNMKDFAARTGADRRDLHRYRAAGGVPERAADRIAVALGLTPELIWGVEVWAEATSVLVERADAQTAARRRRNSRRWRRYIARDPSRQERHNKRRNASYWANRETELARQRAYDQSRKDARRAYRERARAELLQEMTCGTEAENVA